MGNRQSFHHHTFFSLKSTHPKRDPVQLIIILAYLIERWFGLRSHVTSNALLEDVNNLYASTIYRVRDVALSAFIEFTVNIRFMEKTLTSHKIKLRNMLS